MANKKWAIHKTDKVVLTMFNAESIDITENGDLLFKDRDGKITKAVAAGRWTNVQEVVPG